MKYTREQKLTRLLQSSRENIFKLVKLNFFTKNESLIIIDIFIDALTREKNKIE